MVVLLFLCCYQRNYWKSYIELDIPLINGERGHYREFSDQCIVSLSQYIKADVWDFPVYDRMDEINKLFIIWPFHYGPEPAINIIKINNWSADNFKKKKKTPQWVVAWACITVRWHWPMDALFDSCQLTITWMSLRMSTIKHRLYMPCTPS